MVFGSWVGLILGKDGNALNKIECAGQLIVNFGLIGWCRVGVGVAA
jgi:hypothetical protein